MDEIKRKEILEWIFDILVAIAIAIVVSIFIKPIVIKQTSMENNFYENDFVIISKQAYNWFGEIERGDVIVFESELKDYEGNNKNLIKRVIGLPGDTIEIINGYVFVNDELLDEPYVKNQGSSGTMEKITIEEGTIFAMGDNRSVSMDSRELGAIDVDTILGRVVFRIFPIKSIGKIERIDYSNEGI